MTATHSEKDQADWRTGFVITVAGRSQATELVKKRVAGSRLRTTYCIIALRKDEQKSIFSIHEKVETVQPLSSIEQDEMGY